MSFFSFMSSEILLKEINETIDHVKSVWSTLKTLPKEQLESTLISEQVKLNSLKRQQELLVKLNSEFPGRVDTITRDTEELRKVQDELKRARTKQNEEIEKLTLQKQALKSQIDVVIKQLQDEQQLEQLSLFQRETLWELISEVGDLRKRVADHRLTQAPMSSQELSDYEFLSSKIQQNDQLIKDAEQKLTHILDRNWN
jgi:chromosome segregation ATPase